MDPATTPPPPRQLTCERCAEILRTLEAGLDRAGAPLHPNARADLDDVRWLASGTGPVFDEQGMWRREPARIIRGFTDAILVERTAAALRVASELPGFEDEARRLKNWRPKPRSDAERQAAERMYQFDIAAMARLGQPFPVKIAEPDLRIAEISVACKQPRRRSAIPEAVAKGSTQVRAQTGRGIVAVSLQNLVDRLVEGSYNDLRGAADDRALEFLRPQYDGLADRLQRSPLVVSGKTATGILGVLFTTRFLHVDPEGRIRITLTVLPLENPTADVPAIAVLRHIAEGLIKGDARLLNPQAAA